MFRVILILCSATLVFGQVSERVARLHQVLEEVGYEKAVAQIVAMHAEQPIEEATLNNLGYLLLQEENTEAAIAVFALNVRLYPDSVNVYDSLGEGYLKQGNKNLARANYQKALAVLEKTEMADQQREFLKFNAERQLRLMDKPVRTGLPEEILSFLGRGDHPFGKPHPDAPAETHQFGQLAGVWKITNHALYQGRWFSGYEAYWAWKYVLGGFAVQDYWVQPEENLPQISRLTRDSTLTQIRVFDPGSAQWWIGFVNNAANGNPGGSFGSFDALLQENGELVMTPRGDQPGPATRIVFHDIRENRFQWRMDTQQEDGSWLTTTRIDAVRIDLNAERVPVTTTVKAE